MKVDTRLTIELIALAAIVAAVYLATGFIWAALLAFAACLAYLAYIWQFEPIVLKKPAFAKRRVRVKKVAKK